MTDFLPSVMRVLPAVQARQIKELLQDFQAKGQVKNAEEYTAALRELSTLINADVPKPSFQRILSLVWHLCRSDAHSEMMKAVQNDIEAAFLQVDEIGNKLNDHHFLMMKGIISDVEKTLAEQEATITRLEWLASPDNEFSSALVNSFSSPLIMRIPRSELGAEDLYCDNRTQIRKTSDELPSAVIDEHGGFLVLPVENEPFIPPTDVVQLSDEDSYGTEVVVETDNDFSNLIDGERGTFWQRNVYLSTPVEKVTTVLRFNLGRGKDINQIIVEGASTEAFYINDIKGIAPDGHRISLLSTATLVDGKIRIDLDRSFVKAVVVTFSVHSYERVDYFTDTKQSLHDVFNPDNNDDFDVMPGLGGSIKEALAHNDLAKIVGVNTDIGQVPISKYLYRLALDNVWFANSKYADSAIFASRPLKIDDVGVLAVKTVEGTETDGIDNAIEYDIIKKDGPNYKETRFPIPVFGQEEVEHERLVFTKREDTAATNDVGMLRFCPYVSSSYTPQDDYPVKVYKDGQELTIGKDWYYAVAKSDLPDALFDWKGVFNGTANVFSEYKLMPQKMWIKVVNPIVKSLYTVSYTIRTSDATSDDSTIWLDKDQSIFVVEGGKVYIRKVSDGIISSKIYLQVTLRRNAASHSTTPKLLEYAVLGSAYSSSAGLREELQPSQPSQQTRGARTIAGIKEL